jgi:hypothetical protein
MSETEKELLDALKLSDAFEEYREVLTRVRNAKHPKKRDCKRVLKLQEFLECQTKTAP